LRAAARLLTFIGMEYASAGRQDGASQSARVMVVEDDSVVAMAIADSLAAAGYQVVGQVADGLAAISLARREAPDIALVDITLAGSLDGITTARYLVETMGIAIVFLTGHVIEAVREGLEVSRFIIGKPCSEQELLQAIDEALAVRRG
jgi:CheY-like chemotaxis protein